MVPGIPVVASLLAVADVPMVLLPFCRCLGPTVFDIPSAPGVLSIVGVPAMAGASSVFSIHTGVGVSAVARVQLLFTFLLFLVFPPLLVSLIC